MATSPIRIISQPGIKRDGSLFEGENYVDGQWCRFRRGLPRKIQGYRKVVSNSSEKFYGMGSFALNAQEYVHAGTASKLLQYTLDYNATYLGFSDRTPGAGFVANANNLWQIEAMYDSVSTNTRVIAHPGQNLATIDNSTASNIFYGDMTGTAALTNTAVTGVSGGICYIAPYLFKFGNAGLIEWSVANNPADFTTGAGTAGGPGSARVTGAKVIRGMPLRGGGSGPAGLFWSLDSLVRASFVTTAATFAFDTISAETSVLSSMGIVEADGIYYWAGVDRFLMFNGVVREVPNNMNLDWFYNNVNYQWRQKVYAIKIPRWGEIWWCYPRGSATECTDAVIYNYREDTWYDTVLPNGGRTSGVFAKTYEHPFMTGAVADTSNFYRLWKHEETTMNEIDGSAVSPVRSFFETNAISMLTAQEGSDKSMRVGRVEPDFVQSGDMILTVKGQANARATDISSDPVTFPDMSMPVSPEDQTVPLKEVRRLMRFNFESNVIDGGYEMGHTVAHVEPADGRITD